MASIFKKLPAYREEAIRLGNPKIPKFYSTVPPKPAGHHGIIVIAYNYMDDAMPSRGETIFQYQRDLSRYDNGYIIIVRYKENIRPEDYWSLENKILRAHSHMPESVFNQVLLPVILPLKKYVTCIGFSTIHGRPYFEHQEEYSLADLPFNAIPAQLDIPRIQISELVVPEGFLSNDPHAQVVRCKGELYMFKHHGTYPAEGTSTYDDVPLEEVKALSQYSTPFVHQLSYIVTDNVHVDEVTKGRFRGYLVPFLPAGSLEDVVSALGRKHDQNQGPEARPRTPTIHPTLKTRILHISWPVKHYWCIDMAQGVLALHRTKSYIGCLRLGSFVLDKDGHIKLVNISPDTMGFVMPYAAPEVVHKDVLNLELTGARDIFSLGLIFWALAEEIVTFDRIWPSDNPPLSWTESLNSPPQWFRQLVTSCTRIDPSERPSASAILAILTMRLSSPGFPEYK